MFTLHDPDALQSVLDVFETPMFAAERATPESRFRILCINKAHERTSGLTNADIRGQSPHDLLPADEAQLVAARYATCADTNAPLRYREVLHLQTGVFSWDTTIQPVFTGDGRQRILGTALQLPIEEPRNHADMAFDDIRFFSAQAVFQLTQVSSYLEALASGDGHGQDSVRYAEAIVGICRSIDRALSDIRVLAERECASADGGWRQGQARAAANTTTRPEVANLMQGLSEIVARM